MEVTETTPLKKKSKIIEEKLSIPRMDLRLVKLTIVGETPLMVHRFSEKAKKQIEDKQQKKAKAARGIRDPEAEFKASLYSIPGKRNLYGIPAVGLKNCAVSACRFLDSFPMTKAKGAFFVLSDGHGLLPIKSDPPIMDERFVRLGGFKKVADLRYRGRFDKWEIDFTVKFNAGIISPEQLINLFDVAGFSVGLCEYRPEKAGNYGMFKVKRESH